MDPVRRKRCDVAQDERTILLRQRTHEVVRLGPPGRRLVEAELEHEHIHIAHDIWGQALDRVIVGSRGFYSFVKAGRWRR